MNVLRESRSRPDRFASMEAELERSNIADNHSGDKASKYTVSRPISVLQPYGLNRFFRKNRIGHLGQMGS